MASGGYRANAGRPPGTQSKKTVALLDKVMAGGITPMEVLLNDMRYFYTLGEFKMREAEDAPPKEQAKKFRAACELKQIARDCARDVAPYIHSKLASVQANIQLTNVEAELAELE